MDRRFFLKIVVGALLFGIISGATFVGVNSAGNRLIEEQTSEAPTEKEVEKVVDSTAVSTAITVTDVSDIVKNVMPSIVQVTNMSVVEYRGFFGQYYEQEGESSGSGVIVNQDENYLYVATNNHVVTNSRSLTITFCDDAAVSAELLGTYPESDLAVVKVKVSDVGESTLDAIKKSTIGSSENLEVGSSAVVIGNALGYGQSVTTGVISALDRTVRIQGNRGEVFENKLIQTDAAVNPGNSGGALINMNGELIGIVSAKYSDTDVEGMGYAIPITKAMKIVDDIIDDGVVSEATIEETRDKEEDTVANNAYIGISGVDVTEDLAYQYSMPTGIYVSGVADGSGAQKAGLEKGDVITGFENQSIKTMEELQKALSKYSPGDIVTVTVAKVKSSYAETTVIVQLGERK